MKKFVISALTFIMILTLCSCLPNDFKNVNDTPVESLPAPQSLEEVYSLYSKTERNMSKADLDALFGEGTPILDEFGDIKFYNYYNDIKSAGVSVIFDENDVIKTKTLFFNTKQNLIPFSEPYVELNVPSVKSGLALEDAIKIMDNAVPLELSCTFSKEGPLNHEKIYCWYNEDSSNFMLHTENGIIKNVALYTK